jgi:hypothetical protein
MIACSRSYSCVDAMCVCVWNVRALATRWLCVFDVWYDRVLAIIQLCRCNVSVRPLAMQWLCMLVICVMNSFFVCIHCL